MSRRQQAPNPNPAPMTVSGAAFARAFLNVGRASDKPAVTIEWFPTLGVRLLCHSPLVALRSWVPQFVRPPIEDYDLPGPANVVEKRPNWGRLHEVQEPEPQADELPAWSGSVTDPDKLVAAALRAIRRDTKPGAPDVPVALHVVDTAAVSDAGDVQLPLDGFAGHLDGRAVVVDTGTEKYALSVRGSTARDWRRMLHRGTHPAARFALPGGTTEKLGRLVDVAGPEFRFEDGVLAVHWRALDRSWPAVAGWVAAEAARDDRPFDRGQIGVLPKPYRAGSEKGRCDVCKGWHGLPAAHLDYVGHAAVTGRLLAVDPGWTWEPVATDDRGLPALDSAGNLWIKLTVAGVTRLGYGDGSRDVKILIGDAIRNAAMRFGVALDLWSKDEVEGTDPASVSKAVAGGVDDQRDQPAPARPAARPARPAPKRSTKPAPAAAAVEVGEGMAPPGRVRLLTAKARGKGLDDEALNELIAKATNSAAGTPAELRHVHLAAVEAAVETAGAG